MKIFAIIIFWATSLLGQTVAEDSAKIGEFNLSATVAGLLGKAPAQSFEQIIPGDKPIEWAIYVPPNYSVKTPAGVVVFCSAKNSCKIPRAWKKIMQRHNLIWIGANDSGNKITTAVRVTHAILAPTVISNQYSIDGDRIYVSGFSGGGRVASMVAAEYAHLFKGAIFNCGANFWGKKNPRRYDEIKKNRYVFITGSKDFNLRDTKKVYKAYKKAGIENIKLMVIAHMSHKNPGMRDYEKAINFLDLRVGK